jgi:hypothetical protein
MQEDDKQYINGGPGTEKLAEIIGGAGWTLKFCTIIVLPGSEFELA